LESLLENTGFILLKYNEKIKIFDKAVELPYEWDELTGDNPYLTRDFLVFLEKEFPQGQKYYIFYNSNNKPDTIFTTFRNKALNLGLLTKRKLLVDATMVAVPIWVKRPGIVLGKERAADALLYIKKFKGCKFIQCIENSDIKLGYIRGTAAPACTLDIKWKTFNEYMSALRSNYRYRYNKALKKSVALTMEILEDNEQFSSELYELYNQVEKAAKIKIDRLPIGFFRGKSFKTLVFYSNALDKKPVGFVQLLENNEELIFEFVGFDYSANTEFQTYHRMLLEIIRYGIENNFKTIDFGQTADDTKLKLGCRYEYLNVYLHLSNPIKHLFFATLAKFIDYKPLKPNFTVFKEDELK